MIFSALLTCLPFLLAHPTTQTPDFSCAPAVENNFPQTTIEVYMFSDPRCGPCHRAVRDITIWGAEKSLRMIVMDINNMANAPEYAPFYEKYQIEVRDASSCNNKFKNFLPTLYFVDTASGKVVLKIKGWATQDLEKVEHKLRRYL